MIKIEHTTSAPIVAIRLTGGDMYFSGKKSGTGKPSFIFAKPWILPSPWPKNIIRPVQTRRKRMPREAVESRVPQSKRNDFMGGIISGKC